MTYGEAITGYTSLVRRIAYHMSLHLPASVSVDDLVQSGMIGLIEASKKFKNDRDCSFDTYAGIRIRGEIMDELRRSDWTPRSVHHKDRFLRAALKRTEDKKGREATAPEVAAEAGISLEEYFKIEEDVQNAKLFNYERLSDIDHKFDYEGFVEEIRSYEGLDKAVRSLEPWENRLITLLFKEGYTLKQVGSMCGVTESRVCQQLSPILVKLRSRVEELDGIED